MHNFFHYDVPAGENTFNTLRPGQDGSHFADAIFMCIFINENCCTLITLSLKYVRKNPIDNNPALVQIMTWRRSGDKPLSEPMMNILLTHICVTRPQWVNGCLGCAHGNFIVTSQWQFVSLNKCVYVRLWVKRTVDLDLTIVDPVELILLLSALISLDKTQNAD